MEQDLKFSVINEYAKTSKEINIIQLLQKEAESNIDQEKINDLQEIYGQQLEKLMALEKKLIPKEIEIKKLFNQLVQSAIENIIIYFILQRYPIDQLINQLFSEKMKNATLENIKSKLSEENQIYSKFIFYKLSDTEQIYENDYEWIMNPEYESLISFKTCCENIPLNFERVKKLINFLSTLPLYKLMKIYLSFSKTEENQKEIGELPWEEK